MSDQPKIQLPREVMQALQVSGLRVELAEARLETAQADAEVAKARHDRLLITIERDYEFRFSEVQIMPDGTVAKLNRPKPIPPEAIKNISKQPPPEPAADQPAEPGASHQADA